MEKTNRVTSQMTRHMQHKIEFLTPDELAPYAKNSRVHSEEQIDQIVASIHEFGFTNPILIDGQNGIIAGHGRLEAASRMGIEKVPCVRLDHLTDAQKRAYIIADNKLAENATWDDSILTEELILLKEDDFELDLIGFSDDELHDLLPPEISESNNQGQNFDGDGDGDGEMTYSQKIDSPIYEMTGEKPDENELIDVFKAENLINEIKNKQIPDKIKNFLIEAAKRHNVYNFQKIAEYYAHQNSEIQDLMEKSALIIIDYGKAIENGYVKMSKTMAEAFNDNPKS